MSKKFKSNTAADRALKSVSVDLVQQLNLFDTTLHLHAINGLTSLEMEKLTNCYITELERKQYLVTTVIPSKGLYKGMRLLRRALKQSSQRGIFNTLEKAYEDAVDAVIAEKLRLSQATEVKHETGSSYPVEETASDFGDSITSAVCNGSDWLCRDGVGELRKNRHLDRPSNRPSSLNTSSCSSDDDDDDIISLDSPVEQQQTLSSFVDIQFQLSRGSRATLSVTSSPHRHRSNHISHKSNPYKANLKPPEQTVSVAVNVVPNHSNNDDCDDHDRIATGTANHSSDTLQSVDQLRCDSLVMKFVFVGDSATGKTSLLERYISNKFSIASEPTTLIDFKSIELICYNAKYKLHLWDTAGQERFRALTKAYYREAVGGFVVYDVTQRMSLEHCLQWKREIDDAVWLSNGDPIPIVLIANKVDCGQLDGEQFSKEHGFAGYFETSAKTGAGVKEAIHFMVKKVHQLSCANEEPMVRTLSRDRAMSFKLQFNKDDDNGSGRKCCRQH